MAFIACNLAAKCGFVAEGYLVGFALLLIDYSWRSYLGRVG